MTVRHAPLQELDEPFSSPGAKPLDWWSVRDLLEEARVYWLSTVRLDGRPHVTPVAGVWMDGSLFFSTGPTEQKARNLERNTHCVLTTGCNDFRRGVDVIFEGDAVQVEDEGQLHSLATLFSKKYDDHFGFTVREGGFSHEDGGRVDVFEVPPAKVFAYGRGDEYTATRFRF